MQRNIHRAVALAVGIAACCAAALSAIPTRRPVTLQSATAILGLRASQAFDTGDYFAALPMLKKLQRDLADDPAAVDRVATVAEQIRVCERVVDKSNATVPAVVSLSAGRKPHRAPKNGEVLELAIRDLGNFDYDPTQSTSIPADVKALAGHMVRLRGFMIPLDQAANISRFALVPSVFQCCFGGPPQVQHTVVVTCPTGKAVNYDPDEIMVEGKLDVAVTKDDGFVVGIFAVATTSVKPAPK